RIQIEVLMRGERSGRRGVRRRDCDHRRPIEKRVRDAEREIHGARSQRRYADSWPPRELAGGVGHQRGHRFVAREDELDAGLPGGLEKIEHLAARQPEHARDAGVTKGRGENVGACRHYRTSISTPPTIPAATLYSHAPMSVAMKPTHPYRIGSMMMAPTPITAPIIAPPARSDPIMPPARANSEMHAP